MTGTFTLSVDVEGLWGLFIVRSYVDDPTAARAGRDALPRMGRMLADRGMRATFAFVGHLFLERCGPWNGRAHPELPRPTYPWYDRDWYADDPGTDEERDPLWYARSQALELAALDQEIAAHGYSHAVIDEQHVDDELAATEYREARRAAEAAGMAAPTSFVYPQNVVGHVDGLAPAGFRAYRDTDGGTPARAGPPGGLGRARNLLRHAMAAEPPVGTPRVRADGVVVVPSSFPILGREGLRRAVTRSARVNRVKKGLRRAASQSGVLHVWTHPHAFATEAALGDLEEVLDTVAAWRDRGDVEVLAMDRVAARAREGWEVG